MPRVNTATKNKAGKEIQCGRCSTKIEPGTKYFHFSFRYGGKRIRCAAHPPRQSELTQSKMSGVYGAIEGVEDSIVAMRMAGGSIEDLRGDLELAADEVESVRDEYQDGYDNMPENFQNGSTGEEIQDKINALEDFAQSLRDADLPEIEDTASDDDKKKALEEALDNAEQALGELSI